MSLSKEARTGLLVTIALLIFFAGFYFLKGSNIFSGEKEYTCFYENVQGLQTSSNVQVHGLNVGRVSATKLMDGRGVKVTIAISKKIEVPKGTVATLASADLLGTKIIRLDFGNGPGMTEAGDSLASNIEGGLIDNLSTQVSPILKDVRGVVATLDTVLLGVSSIVNAENQKALSNTLAALNTTTNNFSKLSAALNDASTEITSIVHNANSITGNLANNNDKIQNIITNLSTTSDKLASAPIADIFAKLQATSDQLQGIINKINNGQGSLGMMVTDKQLYTNLTNSLSSLNLLMADLKDHPSRYVNISVFGKKK